MLQHTQFMGTQATVLENRHLKAVILPEHGGKVVCLTYKEKNFELLFQNPHKSFQKAHCGDDFSLFEACGFDDAFPAVDAGRICVGGQWIQYPDHGEIWSAAFQTHAETKNAVCLFFKSPLLGYRYEKSFSLDEASLLCDYHIENPTKNDIPALWVCHCLVRCEQDMRVVLPPEVNTVENTFDNAWLGNAKARLSYPLANTPAGCMDLTQIPPHGQLKFYAVDKISTGSCAYEYQRSKVRAEINYDTQMLPYLGFWVTAGGYRGDVNCALEPASGYYDSIHVAKNNKACSVLKAGQSWHFQIRISLSALMDYSN